MKSPDLPRKRRIFKHFLLVSSRVCVCVCLCLCFQLFTGLDVQEWMPALANGSFEDPRLNLITGPSEPRACYAHSFYMTIYGLDICTPIAREILLIDGW